NDNYYHGYMVAGMPGRENTGGSGVRASRTLIAIVMLLMTPALMVAQGASPKPKPKPKPKRVSSDTVRTRAAVDTAHLALITHNDLLLMGAAVAGTVVSSRLDKTVAKSLGDSVHLAGPFRKSAAATLNLLGVPGSFVMTGGMYAVGRLGHRPGLADAGLHAFEGVVFTEAATEVIKIAFGRARPDFAGTDHPGDFSFGRGLKGKGYSAFPSGHASAAFAAAAGITTEMAGRWRHATLYLAPVLFAGAGMVGVARLSGNNHWLSDVFMG